MIQCDTGAIVYSKAPFCIASLIKAADDYVDSVQKASLNSHVLSVMDLRAAPGTSGNSDETDGQEGGGSNGGGGGFDDDGCGDETARLLALSVFCSASHLIQAVQNLLSSALLRASSQVRLRGSG